jgi:hypothetical protein
MKKSDGTEDPSAPWVRVTVRGVVEYLSDIPDYCWNSAEIRDSKGIIHRYTHLVNYDETFVNAYNNNEIIVVEEGSPVAQLCTWNQCDYHHLHYEMEENGKFLSPLASIIPHQDGEIPQIVSISFAVNNSGSNGNNWVPLNTVDPQGCTVVSGGVDIIAGICDRDRAGSSHPGTETLWVYNIRWRACSESNPNCSWIDTYPLDEIPSDWGAVNKNNYFTSSYFSVNAPWISDDSYCQKTSLYAVVTNFVGGIPDKAGFWDTGKIPDGKYIVSVEATDFAGRTVVSSVSVCVRNNSRPSPPKDFRIQP